MQEFSGTNLNVPPWGLRITYPMSFVTPPAIVVAVADVNKTADYSNDDLRGFTLFVFDRNNKSIGGIASYNAKGT